MNYSVETFLWSRVHVVLDIWCVQEQLLAFVEALWYLRHVLIGHLELLCSEVLGLVIQIGGLGDDSVAPA